MSEQIRLWQVRNDGVLQECHKGALDLEVRLEKWLEEDITILASDLMIIGRQVETDFRGLIDLLCIQPNGDLVVVELKKGRTPREITAQALDYASWVADLSSDRVSEIAASYFGSDKTLEDEFVRKFSTEFPEVVNENHSMLIVASEIDESTERIIRYLSDTYGISINAVTFQYFKAQDQTEYVARTFLIEPEQIEYREQTKRGTKRRRRLSYEELSELAQQREVGSLYESLVAGLSGMIQRHNRANSIAFTVEIEGSRRTVFSLIPRDSSREKGLFYQIYTSRFAKHLGMVEEQLLGFLPEGGEHCQFFDNPEEGWRGYTGFFKNQQEVDRFLGAVRKSLS